MSRAFKTLLPKHGIRHAAASPQHPQTNGQVKRSNHTIKDTISSYICPTHEDLDNYVATAVFSLNMSQPEVTLSTPFQLLNVSTPRLPQEHLLGLDTSVQECSAKVDSSDALHQARLRARLGILHYQAQFNTSSQQSAVTFRLVAIPELCHNRHKHTFSTHASQRKLYVPCETCTELLSYSCANSTGKGR